jgi:F-box interacting protein
MDSKEITSEHPGNEECIINGIPRDLIEQIFLKLPVSSLLWCLGVCKHWHKIIRCPQFVAAHLKCAPCCTLLFAPQQSISNELHPSEAVLFDEALSPSTWAVPVIGPDEILCGSCNGLLCLYTNASTIKIANLATGACLHLEKPVKNLRGDHFSFYSFGFHPVTKEYKVAHFLRDHCPYAAGSLSAIQVYTLGSKEWEFVKTPEHLSLKFEKNSIVVNVDGKMYWLTEDRGSRWHHAVMSFDFSEKSFALIQLPTVDLEDYAVDCLRRYWITEIDGKVCVATAQTTGQRPRVLIGKLQIWTLNGKLEQKWRHKYNIQLPSHTIRGLPFVHGDKIVIQSLSGNLYSYMLPYNSFEFALDKRVKLLDLIHRSDSSIRLHIYVRSLVPLDVYRNVAVVRRPNHKERWNSKKFQIWDHDLCKREEIWNSVHQMVPEVLVCLLNFHYY